jgi:hypothetical protein
MLWSPPRPKRRADQPVKINPAFEGADSPRRVLMKTLPRVEMALHVRNNDIITAATTNQVVP